MSETARPLSVGEQVGDYKILGVVGAGGMGVVYKAMDLKLDRTVALKFLPHDLNVGDKDKERFLQEAKTASALDHTNIGVIHGLEKMPDGQIFIVMAYYEGQTLGQKIRAGPLPVDQAVEIVTQVARGLAEAHARNIIHRDIKPSNVIVTKQGVAKIVDFGLARVVSSTSATLSVGVTGTLAYMSPEQARGEPVDQRTDIWSLGVVLAEIVTGRHPFQRESLSAVVLAILEKPPASLEEIPPALQGIIYRMLAKDPANRYPRCKELLADLRRLQREGAADATTLTSEEFKKHVEHASSSGRYSLSGVRPGHRGWMAVALAVFLLAAIFFVPSARERVASLLSGQSERHIAVLPFDNIGNDPANEVVSQGLLDSLTSRLSNLEVGQQSLWVVPASEVRRRKVNDPVAALREFGATLVVKGSMQRDGQSVRLTVNLINTKTLRQIGSAAMEDRAGDFITLQDEAVSRLARLMHIVVTPEMLRATGGNVTPAAYESYLKALGYVQRYDKPGNLDLAIRALESSVHADPRFALGFSELGEAYRLKNQVDPNPKWVDEAAANLQRAGQLDDRLGATYVSLGRLHSSLAKHDLALQEYQKALQIDPRDAGAMMGIAGAYERMGRIADAEANYKRAAALRPDYWDGYNSLGFFYHRQGRFADAIAQYRRVIELTPDNATVYSNLAGAYLALSDPKVVPEAEAALKKSIQLAPTYAAYANLGSLYMNQKRYGESAEMTRNALKLNDKDYRVWNNLLVAYRWIKDDENARPVREKTLTLLEEHVSLHPQDANGQSLLSNFYAENKQREKALLHIEAALALAPKDPSVLADIAESYDDLSDRKRALQYAHESLKNGFTLAHLQSRPALQGLLADPSFRSGGNH